MRWIYCVLQSCSFNYLSQVGIVGDNLFRLHRHTGIFRVCDMEKCKDKSIPVKVYVRVRPLNDAENLRGSRIIVDCPPNKKEVIVNERPLDKITRKFTFDKVFGPDSEQIDVYKSVARPLIKEVLDGYNCTIFAYGQTGAGKTYTMEGRRGSNSSVAWTNGSHAGIIPRAVSHLFDELRLLQVDNCVKASFLEIYNEEIFDLLSPVDDTNKLRLYEDAVRKGAVVVNGLEEIAVKSKEEVLAVLDKGSRKRQTAPTLMNATSSRSHTVFSITVRIKENAVDDELVRTGKLNLVDLAGSENIGRSGAVERRAREAGNINQSLLTLGRVITALVEKTPHVPYRESKLTRLLQESLGGRTKTCIVATISPSQCSMEETLSTLDYAHRAKNIQNKPEVNQKIGKAALIQEYMHEIDNLKSALTAAREKNGIWLAQDNYNEIMTQIECQKRELSVLLGDMKSLTDTLERKEELNRQLSESLQNYLDELNRTKDLLQESEVLLQHHEKTERELSEQAENLLHVANTATSDINLLHQTLVRKRNVETRNLTACKNVTTTSKNNLSDLKHLISNLQVNRHQSSHEIQTVCDKSQELTELRTLQMKENVDCILNSSQAALRIVQDSSNNLVSHTEKQINTTKLDSAATMNLNTEQLVQLLEDVVQRVDVMSKEISEYRTEHRRLNDSISVQLHEHETIMDQYFASFDQHVYAVEETLIKQEQEIKNAVQKVDKQKLHIQEGVNAAFKILENVLQNGVVDADETTETLKTSLSGFKMTTSELNSVKSETNLVKNKLETCQTSIGAHLTASCEMAAPDANKLECLGSGVCQSLAEEISSFPEKQRHCLDSIHENLNSVSEILISSQSKQEQEIKKLHDGMSKFSASHRKILEQTRSEKLKYIEECRTQISRGDEYLKSWNLRAVDSISLCEQMMENFVTKEILEDSPSGNTPQRREFIYPQTLAATSPHERILSRFRTLKIEETSEEASASSSSSSSSSSLSDRLQESIAGSSISYSENSQISVTNSQNPIGKLESKSTSNICNESAVLKPFYRSEPNIPNALLEKENSKSLQSVTGAVRKCRVLSPHNK